MNNWFKSENVCLRLPLLLKSDENPFELPQREDEETIYTSVKICSECSILNAFLSNNGKFYNTINILFFIYFILTHHSLCRTQEHQRTVSCIGNCGTNSINLMFYFKNIRKY